MTDTRINEYASGKVLEALADGEWRSELDIRYYTHADIFTLKDVLWQLKRDGRLVTIIAEDGDAHVRLWRTADGVPSEMPTVAGHLLDAHEAGGRA